MCRDILILVKKLYKSCLITAEERIKIKKLIISKSKKIIDFYIKEYENIKDDNLKSANAIKNLLYWKITLKWIFFFKYLWISPFYTRNII